MEVKPDGSFELGGLRPGTHYIQVSPFWLSAADANNGTSAAIEVVEGEVREGVMLQWVQPELTTYPGMPPKSQPIDIPATNNRIDSSVGKVIFTAGDKIFSTPCFDDTSMFFGACDGNFYCLDKKTGKLIWKLSGRLRIDSSPAIADGIVYFANAENYLHAVNAATGKVIWAKKIKGCGYNDPLLHGDQVLIAGTDQLVSFDPKDGRAIATYPFDGNGRAIAAVGSKLVVLITKDYEANDFVGTGSVACFDLGVETAAWTLPLGGCSFGSIVCDDTCCYFGTRDGKFSAVELATGKLAWSKDCADFFINREKIWPGSDVIDNGDSVVFTCTHQSLNDPGAMICVAKADGMTRWSLVSLHGYANSNGITF